MGGSSSDVLRLLATVLAFALGLVTTGAFYLSLFVLQIVNADNACESFPQSVPGADFSDVRGVEFENSWINLGGSCVYHMMDGTSVHAFEPGLWFPALVISIVLGLASLTLIIARRKRHFGLLFGAAALIAPFLALLMAIIVPARTR